MITSYKESNPCKDNVSNSLRYRQILFTFPAFLNLRIESNFRLLQTQVSAV